MGKNRQKHRKRDRRLGELQYDAGGKQVDDRDTEAGKSLGYKDIVRENKLFEEFYKSQGICPEDQWEEMMRVLRTDLPASFRITGTRSQAEGLRGIIEGTFFSELTAAHKGDQTIALPKVLPWVPGGGAYQLNLTRQEIKKREEYQKLHSFLIAETDVGAISRQETVSMLPPLVLGVEPHHKVLDMCAAPGSKTAQLIEALHEVPSGTLPTGFLVANDADNARCYMLTHQTKRLQSPAFVVVNHDASALPNMFVPTSDPTRVRHLKFDRILCDVPCTGDGTLRKNADIWPKWNPVNATNLHGIQYKIARRGLELLEVGGRLVYSTCSLHPVEGEAVVARLLQECQGAVQLVETAHKLPGLKFSRGLSTWKPASKEGELYNSWEEVPEKFAATQIRPSMFPPSKEDAASMHLDRCLRLLPHHQNTGGFFVALLEKSKPCPWEKDWVNSNEDSVGIEEIEAEEVPPNKKVKYNNKGGLPPRARGFKEDPFTYFKPEDEAVYKEVQEFYDLSLPFKGFLSRGKEESKKKNLYFTTEQVRQVVETNVERLRMINTGVKAFIKCEDKGSSCSYRLAQEGALSTVPFLGKRVLTLDKANMELLLMRTAEIDRPPMISDFSENVGKVLRDFSVGSLAYVYRDSDTDLAIEVVGWLGERGAVRAYVAKTERAHYLRLLGGDTHQFEQENKFVKRELNSDAQDVKI